MKTRVRFLSMLLAIVMIASAALTASAAETEVVANNEALQLLVDLGIFGGYDDGSLKPDQLVERDEMAKIIFVLYTTYSDAGAAAVSFKDVAADNWAAGYISWCSSKGIVGGYGDGNFGPDDHVTYDQALKMVCGALGYTEWDSRFWPVDVRTKALTDLNLGENITGVKGGDFVTRAQIAQIVYNALFAKMKETKTINQLVPGYDNFYIPRVENKTLAVDVWNFGEVFTAVDATAEAFIDNALSDEDMEVRLENIGEFTLEELGLEEYASKLEDLLFAKVRVIYDAKKVSDVSKLTSDEIIAVSVTETVEKALTLKYDEKDDELTLNGKEFDEEAVELVWRDNGQIIALDITLDEEDADTIKAVIKEIETFGSVVNAYDSDEDDDYDMVFVVQEKVYEVKSVGTKSIAFGPIGVPTSTLTVDTEKLVASAELEEEDIVVITDTFGKKAVKAVIAPVTEKAVKFSKTKLTLETTGEVVINDQVFSNLPAFPIDETVIELNDKGETTAYNYYIYNGKVFHSNAVADESTLQFAILSYVNPQKVEYNEATKQDDVTNTALITVDGREYTVTLAGIDNLTMEYDADEIFKLYGKVYTNDGIHPVDPEDPEAKGKYILNHYTLVTYTVDEDGVYTLNTSARSDDFEIYPVDSTIVYDDATGLCSVIDADENVLTNKAILTDDSLFYYTYQKNATGKYTYLGSYTEATLPENFASAKAVSPIYAVYNEETKFYEIKLAMIDNETVETAKKDAVDFRTDARQIFYCYQGSNQVMASDSKNLNYSYFMRSIYNGSNLAEVVNTELTAAEGATKAVAGHLYAWDEDTKNYVEINKTNLEALGVTSLDVYTLTDVINGCIITEEEKYLNGAKIAPDASIWTLRNSATAFVTLTVEGVQTSLEIAAEGGHKTECLVGTALNEYGEEEIKVLIIKLYEYNSNGEIITDRNTTPINSFKS